MSFVIRLVRSKLGANAIHLTIFDKSITWILFVTGYAHQYYFLLSYSIHLIACKAETVCAFCQFFHMKKTSYILSIIGQWLIIKFLAIPVGLPLLIFSSFCFYLLWFFFFWTKYLLWINYELLISLSLLLEHLGHIANLLETSSETVE